MSALQKGGWQNALSSDALGFLKEASRLQIMGFGIDAISEQLELKIQQELQAYQSVSRIFRNIAKYPPALGMAGTVLGLVDLFRNLNPDSRGSLGTGLAVAMTATFYGLVATNFILLPLADRFETLRQKEEASLNALCTVLVYHLRLRMPQGENHAA